MHRCCCQAVLQAAGVHMQSAVLIQKFLFKFGDFSLITVIETGLRVTRELQETFLLKFSVFQSSSVITWKQIGL